MEIAKLQMHLRQIPSKESGLKHVVSGLLLRTLRLRSFPLPPMRCGAGAVNPSGSTEISGTSRHLARLGRIGGVLQATRAGAYESARGRIAGKG
jgi:hypothetical protein